MAVFVERTGDAVSAGEGGVSLSVARAESARLFRAYWYDVMRDQERRQNARRSLSCPLELIPEAHDSDVIPAQCVNVGNGGLFATLQIGYGVAIGQRYQFRLEICERGPEPGLGQHVVQGGEVVRVELMLGEDGYADRIGIGVRLFGPRSGLIPMPHIH